jgi:hypothetical protein
LVERLRGLETNRMEETPKLLQVWELRQQVQGVGNLETTRSSLETAKGM